MYLACRLRVYVEFLHGLKACLARDNLETAVIKLYECILRFLAQAIHTYQTSTVHRSLTAIWNEGDVATFERKCMELAQDAQNEASNCDRTKYQEDMRVVLGEFETIHSSLDRCEVETKIDQIPYAGGAIYNAHDSIHGLCHPETRLNTLQQIREWFSQPDAKTIFWLSGPPGTGKSTVSFTIAKELDKDILAATFFFKRGEGDRGSSLRFFSTIVKQLAINIPEMKRPIVDAIRLDPFIFDKALAEQFNKLILGPLLSVETQPAIVVVDALDECDNESDIKTIVYLWSLVPPARLKLLLTSRPETPIRMKFAEMPQCHQHVELDLAPNIKDDLAVYIKSEFSQIHNGHSSSLARDWINQDTVDKLVELSFPLFIVAATICRFVGDPDWIPKERLRQILDHPSTGHLSNIERAYLPILTHVMAKCQKSDDPSNLKEQFESVIGAIVCLIEPLSATALATLLDMREDIIRLRLDPLYSVLSIPDDRSPIRVLHLSFPEFLLSRGSRSMSFGVVGTRMHALLTDHCIRLLSMLQQNPLGLPPGKLRIEIEPGLIEFHFSPALRYACRYWVHHLKESRTHIDTGSFLRQHFLHWLEALSLLGCLTEAISFVETLIQICPSDDFLEDARRFVLANRYIIDLAPVQVYVSAIIFAPQTSEVKATRQIPAWLSRYPEISPSWGPELQKLQGHTASPLALTISPDESLLASASADETVRLWNIKTGREVQCFARTGEVMTVAFSSDGLELVSVTSEGMFRAWDIPTGQERKSLDTQRWPDAVAVSPDNLKIAMAISDNTIRLLYITTGQDVGLTGHTSEIQALAFSTDGFSLASASDDHTIRIWDIHDDQPPQILQHNESVLSVAFSTDRSLLASGTTIAVCIWDALNGHFDQRIKVLSRDGCTASVVFSPDASLLASGSSIGTIHLWDTKTGQRIRSLHGHDRHIFTLVFARNELLLSGSMDHTIRLWDVKPDSEEQIMELNRRYDLTSFSPDGSLLAVTAETNKNDIWSWHMQTDQTKHSKLVRHDRHFSFSPDNSLLTCEIEADEFGLCDVKTEEMKHTFRGHGSLIRSIAFSLDGSLLATASGQMVYTWDVPTGQRLQEFLHDSDVWTLAFSPAGSLLAMGCTWDLVAVWDIERSPPTRTMHKVDTEDSSCDKVAITEDGKMLALLLGQSRIRLWNLEARQQLQVLEGVSALSKMEFAYDDQYLKTSRGLIRIDADSLTFCSIACPQDWIQYGDQKLVWLPREYRGRDTDHYERILAIAQHGGGMGFWQLHNDRDFTV